MSTQDGDDRLALALVDLFEAVGHVSPDVRREAAARADQPVLSGAELAALRTLLRTPGATADVVASRTGYPRAVATRALRSLESRELVVGDGDRAGPLRHFRATPAGVALRTGARERAQVHIRFALAGLPAGDRAALEDAARAVSSLAIALGFEDIHRTYA